MAQEEDTIDATNSLVFYLKDLSVVGGSHPLAEQKSEIKKIAAIVRRHVKGGYPPYIEEALWPFLPVLRHAKETADRRRDISFEELLLILGFAVATNEDFEDPAAVREMKEWAESIRDRCKTVDGIRALSIFTGLFMLHGPSLSFYFFLVCGLAFDVRRGIHAFKEAWEKWLMGAMEQGSPEKDKECVEAFVNVGVRTVAAGFWTLEFVLEDGGRFDHALKDILGVEFPLPEGPEYKKLLNEYVGRVQEHFGSFVEPIAEILEVTQIEIVKVNKYVNALDTLRNIIEEKPPNPSPEGENWLAQPLSRLLDVVDHVVTTVVEASGDPSRRAAILKHVQTSLECVQGFLVPREPIDLPDQPLEEEKQLLSTDKVVERFRKAVEKGREQRDCVRSAVRELLDSRLKDVNSAVYLREKDAVLKEIQKNLVSEEQPREGCGQCGKPNRRNRCSVCLMLVLSGEDDSGKRCYEKVKAHLRPGNEIQYLSLREIIDSEFNHFLEIKVSQIVKEVSDMRDRIYKLEHRLQDVVVMNEQDRKEIKDIEGNIPEVWPEELKKLFKDRIGALKKVNNKKVERRKKLYCKSQGDSLVISKYSLKISEVNRCLQEYSIENYKELVLVGELEIITDAKLRCLPGINVTVLTRTIRLEEGGCELRGKGSLSFTIDTSGRNGDAGERGRRGADYNSRCSRGGKDSEDGEDGERGGDGTPGQSAGHVCLIANMVLNGKIVVLANGGNGGKGGDGGNGGKGKNGKDGKDGEERLFARRAPRKHPMALLAYPKSPPVAPGRGGNAGRAGRRGGGGYKGDVKLTDCIQEFVETHAEDGKAGEPGKVGTPGEPGDGGRFGKGYLRVWEERGKPPARGPTWEPRRADARMEDTSKEAASKILGCSTRDISRPTEGLYLSNTNVEKARFPSGMPTDDDTLVDGRIVSRVSLRGKRAEANQAIDSAERKEKSHMNSDRYAGSDDELKRVIDDILKGDSVASDLQKQSSAVGEFYRNVEKPLRDIKLHAVRLTNVITSTECAEHIHTTQAYRSNTLRDSTTVYQARSLSPQWPRVGSCGLLKSIRRMETFQKYNDHLACGGSPGLTVEFVRCCVKFIGELCEEHKDRLVEGYAQTFAEKLRKAMQTHIKTERNCEVLLQLYISLGGGKDTFHDGPIRQACLRQLYVAHVEMSLWDRKFTEIQSMTEARRAARRLRTCDPTLFDKLVRDAGACPMCPQKVLKTLREHPTDWQQKMRRFGMDVEQLISKTLGKHDDKAREHPCVMQVCDNFANGLRDSPEHEVWAEEPTLFIFQWLRKMNQERANGILHTFHGLFVGEGKACGTIFLNKHTLHNGMTVDMALRLILVWADFLLAKLCLSGSGVLNYVVDLLNLSIADKRSLEELRNTEGQPKPLWSRVGECIASHATFDDLVHNRNKLMQTIHGTPLTQKPTTAQRFLLSFLNTTERCRLSAILRDALKKGWSLSLLETCLCEYVHPPPSGGGGWNRGERSAEIILEILMDRTGIQLPSPEDCGKCQERLKNPIKRAYKIIEKGRYVEQRRQVAERLQIKEDEMTVEAFAETVERQIQQSMRASRLWHLHEKLITLYNRQCKQPDIVECNHREPLSEDIINKLRDLEKGISAKPPRPISLEKLLSLFEEVEPFLAHESVTQPAI
ncbi:unnamed protein product [Trypanosoma congolense IL3000]|uniref:WGS project CAEQ00000000 data, annotated contig 1488 n=1 Tax=Trypanosoma congolense (strain IL3000) TaxID=1068625 RepID=F9W6L3_TRYCI|nr:unnamed protein product [Trypanosoma congolense IL3000]